MAQQAVDDLRALLGEDRATFLDFVQDSTRQKLADAVASTLQSDADHLEKEVNAALLKLPGWLRGIARNALGGHTA